MALSTLLNTNAIVLLISFICFFSSSFAQQPLPCLSPNECIPFEGSPLTRGKCDWVVTWNDVCISNSTNQQIIDAETAGITRLFSTVVPRACRDAAIRFTCAGSFPRCFFADAFGVFLVAPPCRSICDTFVDECTATATALGVLSLLPVCDELVAPGFPRFPNDTTGTFCTLTNLEEDVPYFPVDCPYPLTFKSRGQVQSPSDYCELGCLWDMYSDAQWQGLFWILYIFSAISLILCSFFVLTRSLSFVGRSYPAVLVLWFHVCLMGIACTLLLPVLIGGYENILCDDEGGYYEQAEWSRDYKAAFCVIQGMGLIFFTTGAAVWWMSVSYNLFEVVVLGVEKSIFIKYHKYFHIFAWGLPTLEVVLGVSFQNVISRSGFVWCFLDDPDESAWSWSIYFAPLILILLTATSLSIITIVRLIMLKILRKSQVGLAHIIRLGLLVFYFWYVITFIVIYKIYAEVKQDDLEDAVEDQVRCGIQKGGRCDLDDSLEYGVYVVYVWNAAACGGIVFLISGTSADTVLFWVNLFRNMANARSRQDLKHALAYTTSAGPSIDRGRSTGDSTNSEHFMEMEVKDGEVNSSTDDFSTEDDDDMGDDTDTGAE